MFRFHAFEKKAGLHLCPMVLETHKFENVCGKRSQKCTNQGFKYYFFRSGISVILSLAQP